LAPIQIEAAAGVQGVLESRVQLFQVVEDLAGDRGSQLTLGEALILIEELAGVTKCGEGRRGKKKLMCQRAHAGEHDEVDKQACSCTTYNLATCGATSDQWESRRLFSCCKAYTWSSGSGSSSRLSMEIAAILGSGGRCVLVLVCV